ncbi:Pro-resilin-like 131 [Homarus americanus]|uniref:Pro-resilin-like 131 n=1 Tax=Homarus americanus TaxID=6706 RepID=A0A8J5JPM1_HOMAM|nr:Pro-resilin-like 131 [Homarus americanus]
MFLKVLVGVAAVVMCVVADGVGYDGGHVHYAPIPYDFGYGVADQYTGTDFGHTEHSDGNVVKGRYYVRLPDGRKQIVTCHTRDMPSTTLLLPFMANLKHYQGITHLHSYYD